MVVSYCGRREVLESRHVLELRKWEKERNGRIGLDQSYFCVFCALKTRLLFSMPSIIECTWQGFVLPGY